MRIMTLVPFWERAKTVDLFKDKIAVVTGGASGIGRALCEQLGRREAVVTVADRDDAGADRAASTIRGAGGRALPAVLDVSEAEAVERLVDETVSRHGRLDYIFNNAGIGFGGEARDMELDDWRRVIDINLYGVLHGTAAAYRVMIDQGFGHIVNTASGFGLIPAPGEIAYATTKHAVVGLSTSLRPEAEGLGVKVSVVCPGLVETAIWNTSTILNVNREEVLSLMPLKKISAEKAAEATLKGVARNRAIIVFPLHARISWWLWRFRPSLLAPLHRKVAKDFRAVRNRHESGTKPPK